MTVAGTKNLSERQREAAKLMKRILLHMRTLMDEQLRPYGVTKAQIQLLYAIRTAPRSSGAHLSRLCDVTPQTMQTLLQRAEESGWIVRSKDSVNDRILAASLTPSGEELLVMADQVVKNIEASLWKGIPAESLESLIAVLEQCLGNLPQD